jgi:hypothetical protein
MAAMDDVFTANPGRFGDESWHYREAETFSVTFLRKPLLMGSALGSPDALLAELTALDACLDRLSQGEHERRFQLMIVLGMGTGRDGVFAPDTGSGGGGSGKHPDRPPTRIQMTKPDVGIARAIPPDKTVREILKDKLGSIKQAPLERGSPSWDDILDETWAEVERKAKKRQVGYNTFSKLLKNKRFDK